MQEVDNFDKLVAVTVTLVTIAKEEGEANSTTAARYWGAAGDFKWGLLKQGKIVV